MITNCQKMPETSSWLPRTNKETSTELYHNNITCSPWVVRLSLLENACSRPLFRLAILTRNVGQTDLVFSVRSGFVSRSMRARLQVLVCSGYNLCHRGYPFKAQLLKVLHWFNLPVLISDIRALWRSVLSARVPECQKLKMHIRPLWR